MKLPENKLNIYGKNNNSTRTEVGKDVHHIMEINCLGVCKDCGSTPCECGKNNY